MTPVDLRLPLWLVVSLWWGGFGVLHGLLRVAIMPAIPGGAARTVAMATAQDLFWIPVTLLAVALVRTGTATTRGVARTLAGHVGLLAASLCGWPIWSLAWFWIIRHQTLPYGSQWSATAGTAIVTYGSIGGLAHAVRAYQGLLERRRHLLGIDAELARARLASLTVRLQPHFLFNTLHLVAELAHEDGATARRVLQALRHLLASAFDSTAAREVPLRDELAFLAPYLAIQRRRYGARLRVVQEVEDAAGRMMVPALLLQPLVENAIRHSVGARPGIRTIGITATTDDTTLHLVVWDDGEGPSSQAPRAGARGMGLRQTAERLATVFPGAHSLALQPRPGGGAEVVLSLPARTASPASDPLATAAPATPLGERAHRAPFLLDHLSHWSAAGGTAALVALLQFQMELAWTSGLPAAQAEAPTGPLLAAFTIAALVMVPLLAALLKDARRLAERPAMLLGHAAVAATGVAVVHVLVLAAVARLLGVIAIAPGSSPVLGLGLVDFLAFLAITGLWSALGFASAARREQVKEAERQHQLATEALDDYRWQLQPALLLHVLDRLIEVAGEDAARLDAEIGEFAALLRLLLEHQAETEATVEADVALALSMLRVLDDPQGAAAETDVDLSPDAESAPIRAFTVPATLLVALGFPGDAPRRARAVSISARQVGPSVRVHGDVALRGHAPDAGQLATALDVVQRRLSEHRADGATLTVACHDQRMVFDILLPSCAGDPMPSVALVP